MAKAISAAGTQEALAKRLGIRQCLVSQWLRGKRPVASAKAVRIEQLFGGEVTRQDLRPDDWWEIWPELSEPTKRRTSRKVAA